MESSLPGVYDWRDDRNICWRHTDAKNKFSFNELICFVNSSFSVASLRAKVGNSYWRATSGRRGIFVRPALLPWIVITLQLTYFETNLCNRHFNLNPPLTSTRNIYIYCQAENIKTSWLMWKWWYPFVEVHTLANNFCSKIKYIKSHLRTNLRGNHLGDVLLLLSTNISSGEVKLSHNKQKHVSLNHLPTLFVARNLLMLLIV